MILRHLSFASPLVICCGLTLLVAAGVPPASAAVPYLDPFPWEVAPDSAAVRTLLVHGDRFDDETTCWTANRVGVTGALPVGTRSLFFFRAYFMAFHTSNLPALERWPSLAGEDVPDGWPHERRINSFVRPELGLLGEIGLPGLGRTRFGLACGLPVGRDDLYPFTAASIPCRLELRKDISLATGWRLALEAGRLFHLDSAHEYLTPEAFPGGVRLGAGAAWRSGPGRSLGLAIGHESLDGGRSTRLSLHWWLPWGGRNGFGLILGRELTGPADRPFATQLTLVWRLNREAEGENDASSP